MDNSNWLLSGSIPIFRRRALSARQALLEGHTADRFAMICNLLAYALALKQSIFSLGFFVGCKAIEAADVRGFRFVLVV